MGSVIGPEQIQNFRVTNSGRIKGHAQAFRMIAHTVICGIGGSAAGITHSGSHNAVNAPKLGVGVPESAKAEDGGLDRSGGRGVVGGGELGAGLGHGRLLSIILPAIPGKPKTRAWEIFVERDFGVCFVFLLLG